jgi:hypothetical protein
MIAAIMLTVALNAAELPREELERLYWHCDTEFMKGELGGQDMWSCLSITEEFQKYFDSRDDFLIYWNDRKMTEWAQRGYRPGAEFY